MVDDKRDAELLHEFRQGNIDAFAEFVGRHQDAIYRLALRNLGDPEAAQDAAQEVFIRALQKLGRWQFGRGKPFTWLYRTLVNVCREIRKKTNRQQAYHHHLAESLLFMQNTAKAEKDHLERRHLVQLIDELPGRQREVIVLHIYEDLTLKEVADVLSIPLGTVKSNYHKALVNLRRGFSVEADRDLIGEPIHGPNPE